MLANVFLLCLHVQNCFPALFHVIRAYGDECSFTIISLCSSRTPTTKVPFEIEIMLANVFLLCLHVQNCFPALFHVIRAYGDECSFTIISLCSSRTPTTKVPFGRG